MNPSDLGRNPATSDDEEIYTATADQAIDLANHLANNNPEADVRDVAEGLLAGAIHYWLYTCQPCGDPMCTGCEEIDSASKRLAVLLEATRELAEASDYFHSINDSDVGRA